MARTPVISAVYSLALCLSLQPACLDWTAPERSHPHGDAAVDIDEAFEGRTSGRADASAAARDGAPSQLADERDAALADAAGSEADAPITPDAGLANQDAHSPDDDDAGPLVPPADGLVLSLHMEESIWQRTPGEVRDGSGAGNHGVAVEQANTLASGRFGRAGAFNGSAWVDVPDSETLHPTSAFTVSAWFNLTELPSTTGTWPGIVAKRREYGAECTFTIFATPGDHLSVDVAGEDTRFESRTVLEARRWYHVALVFDGSLAPAERVRLYVDGVLDTTALETSASIPPYPAALTVGNLKGGGNTFVGAIDEVAFWRRALPAGEVTVLAHDAVSP